MLAFAGLFEEYVGEGGEVLDSCTVLTKPAGPDLEDVHHRMPVLVEPALFDRWLSADLSPPEQTSLFEPAPAGTLKRRPVARTVNNARIDDPACLEDPPPPEQPDLFALQGD